LGHVWGGKYRGQKQKWFALQFLGQDSEISIDTDDPEFRTWAWMSAEDLLDSIVEFKRAVYAEVFAEFADLLK
jgi:putative (di)nucleoside polyphosphate hydrolase